MRIRLKLDRLHALIAHSNLTQNHWAMKLSLSRGHWSDIVNGRHPFPSARTRERMLEAFGVAFEELFEVQSGPSGLSDHNFQAALADRYLIDHEVGQGGMGTVYVARDVKHGRLVALKIVSPEAVSGIGTEQFLKEIRYTARLTHHHILPLFDSGEAAGYPYYVMPYIRAGSLRDLLNQKQRLPIHETLTIARGIGSALTHAHQHHVLHCDVKPANVLLSSRHAFVADFGISRAIHAEAFEWGKRADIDSSAGTPAYVSPEQASGERNLDARSDLYSLACMTFEMLVGQPPFKGTTTIATVAQRFQGDPPNVKEVLPDVPIRIANTIGRAMALDAERRHESVSDFINALESGAAHHESRLREAVHLVASRTSNVGRKLLGLAPASPRPSRTRNKVREMLGSIKQDISYALRTFVRTPAFSLVVILTLAFGIAANTFVFSLMNPYFFRPLPFGNADQLVQLGQVEPIENWPWARFSLPMYEDWKARSRAFDDIAAYTYSSVNLTGSEGAKAVTIGELTGNMFSVLQANAALGRTFLPEEQGPAAPRVAVLGDILWKTRYGSDPGVLGQSIVIDGVSHTVIGVMPPAFNFPFGDVRLWIPIYSDVAQVERGATWNLIIGRLKPDWSIERAREELVGIQRELSATYPDADGHFVGVTVAPIREALNFVWDILRMMFTLLLAAVAFALVIACVNVASLTLARSAARTSEVAVRTALGAGRGRLVRQFMTESLMLSVAGGVLGIGIAYVAARAVGRLIPESLYKIGEATIDIRVLLFTMAITLAAPLLFGLTPALTAVRTNLSVALKEGGRAGWSVGSLRLRRGLVVFEIAMAVVLIAGMGLMIRSFIAVQNADLGFESNEVLTVEITLPELGYSTDADVRSYFTRAIAQTRTVPGVRSSASAAFLPLNHETASLQFARPGQVPATSEEWPAALYNRVSPGYFEAMSIRLTAGRSFEMSDGPDALPVIIVSEQVASAVWPGENPVGQTLLAGDPTSPTTYTVVGVVGDIKHEGIVEDARMYMYRPMPQHWTRREFLVLETDRPEAAAASVRRALQTIDPDLPLVIRPYTSIVRENTTMWSLSSGLLAVLGGAAILLASLGIYGIIAFTVVQRRREIGLRLALGATETDIRKIFLGEGLKLSVAGLVLGLVLAAVVSRLLTTFLFGVSALDPLTFVGVLLLFVAVSLIASFAPARRASRVDPLGVLRYE